MSAASYAPVPLQAFQTQSFPIVVNGW